MKYLEIRHTGEVYMRRVIIIIDSFSLNGWLLAKTYLCCLSCLVACPVSLREGTHLIVNLIMPLQLNSLAKKF